jgi:hypothetical protein
MTNRESILKGKEVQKSNTLIRYERIAKEFWHLYENQRIRKDDCYKILAKNNGFSVKSIQKMVRSIPKPNFTAFEF